MTHGSSRISFSTFPLHDRADRQSFRVTSLAVQAAVQPAVEPAAEPAAQPAGQPTAGATGKAALCTCVSIASARWQLIFRTRLGGSRLLVFLKSRGRERRE